MTERMSDGREGGGDQGAYRSNYIRGSPNQSLKCFSVYAALSRTAIETVQADDGVLPPQGCLSVTLHEAFDPSGRKYNEISKIETKQLLAPSPLNVFSPHLHLHRSHPGFPHCQNASLSQICVLFAGLLPSGDDQAEIHVTRSRTRQSASVPLARQRNQSQVRWRALGCLLGRHLASKLLSCLSPGALYPLLKNKPDK